MSHFFNGWIRPHLVTIAIALLGAVSGYAVQAAQVKDNTARIQQLERDSITPREYQELLRRLDRIETKLDEIRVARQGR